MKCSCPIWADGYRDGKRTMRQSLKTRDMARARKKAMILESSEEKIYKSIDEAVDAFLKRCNIDGLGDGTLRKYTNTLNKLKEYCEKTGIDNMMEVDLDVLDGYRGSRSLAPVTTYKELELLRQFCEFCRDRKWMDSNPAKKIKPPRISQANMIEPYTREQIDAIFKAASEFGQEDYERKRALAMVMVLRYTALRITDMATLSMDRISWTGERWRIFLHTAKNGKLVFLSIPEELIKVLDELPVPRGTEGERKYYFWNGTSKKRSLSKSVDETLRAVFKRSGVPSAHAHRFRHTLATELLGEGASFEDIADILGNSVEIVIKHYAKFSPKRQERIDTLMDRVFGFPQKTKLRRVK